MIQWHTLRLRLLNVSSLALFEHQKLDTVTQFKKFAYGLVSLAAIGLGYVAELQHTVYQYRNHRPVLVVQQPAQ